MVHKHFGTVNFRNDRIRGHGGVLGGVYRGGHGFRLNSYRSNGERLHQRPCIRYQRQVIGTDSVSGEVKAHLRGCRL
jgi:hypothetical protein